MFGFTGDLMQILSLFSIFLEVIHFTDLDVAPKKTNKKVWEKINDFIFRKCANH